MEKLPDAAHSELDRENQRFKKQMADMVKKFKELKISKSEQSILTNDQQKSGHLCNAEKEKKNVAMDVEGSTKEIDAEFDIDEYLAAKEIERELNYNNELQEYWPETPAEEIAAYLIKKAKNDAEREIDMANELKANWHLEECWDD